MYLVCVVHHYSLWMQQLVSIKYQLCTPSSPPNMITSDFIRRVTSQNANVAASKCTAKKVINDIRVATVIIYIWLAGWSWFCVTHRWHMKDEHNCYDIIMVSEVYPSIRSLPVQACEGGWSLTQLTEAERQATHWSHFEMLNSLQFLLLPSWLQK